MQSRITYVLNSDARREGPEGKTVRFFSPAMARQVRRFHQSFPEYNKTDLVLLPNLARELGIANLWIKDESSRFGLSAFKVLGATHALYRLMAKEYGAEEEPLCFDLFQSADIKKKIKDRTVVTATDGNHGRALAWAAQRLGCRAVVYLPKGSSPARMECIRSHGAEVVVVDGNYDEAVCYASDQAQKQGWLLIQDTAWEGYQEIPIWIMQGYMTLMDEALEQLNGIFPTHVLAQCGVGSFSSALQAYLFEAFGVERPLFIVVEPTEAACYYRSVVNGTNVPQNVEGNLNTIMAGLACGRPSLLAWKILKRYADVFVAVDDEVALKGMRRLHCPVGDDRKIVSGESGAVTTGFLITVLENPVYREIAGALKLDVHSRVLVISTEGDTDPDLYKKIVGEKVDCG